MSSTFTQLVAHLLRSLRVRSAVTWGNPDFGGDSSGVKDQLKGVQQVLATDGAFAAILADGSVVTWGDRRFCSDSSGIAYL